VTSRPTALVFRKELLPWSETFIAAQGGALERYRPVFVGFRLGPAGNAYLAGRQRILLAEHAAVPALSRGLLKQFGWVTPGFRRALAAEEPVLVHAHFGTNAPAAIPIARALAVPLVVTFHGADIASTARTSTERARRARVFASAARVIAVSDFIAGRLRANGCPAERITVHHIGVDTRLFRPDGDAPRAANLVLFVGRLVSKKGLTHLLAALPAVLRAVPGAELVVAGDGPLRAALEREAAGAALPVRFLGVQAPAAVRDLMCRAAVLCAPGVVTAAGDAEGLPMTIVEAQACGLPVVTTPSGGSAEGVVDGETGFVVPPGDAAALATALVAVLGDAAFRERAGAAARARALAHFDLRIQTARLESIYDEVRGAR
jgi:glycosyltransferase involved in cell wall biosynthesis